MRILIRTLEADSKKTVVARDRVVDAEVVG
ncbi:MAG: hypothetical protein RIS70_3121, partial [Planctomycetota bacterium]